MADFKATFKTSSSGFSSSFGKKNRDFNSTGTGNGTLDHRRLLNRDKANQHPISAIEGLEGELARIPEKVSDLPNDAGYITGYTETDPTVPAWAKAESKPTYTAEEVGALADDTFIPEKVSDLTNDAGYISTETDPTVPSWAKAASKPTYTASEVGALADDTFIPEKVSDLTNDSGYISTETDPTVPSWAKASTKPTYTASEVGALPATTAIPSKTSDLTNDSDFVSDANYVHTDSNFTAEEKTKLAGIAAGATVDDHKWNSVQLIESMNQSAALNPVFVPIIPASGTRKVAYYTEASNTPIAGNLPKYDASRYIYSRTPSANDNSTKVATTAYVDGAVPTKTSDLTNDSGFITREDLPSDTGVVSVNGQDGIVVLDADDVGALPDTTVIPSKTSDLTNDSGFITGYTETDPTVPSWAKAATKPVYTAAEVGALPDDTAIPTKTSDLTNDSGFITAAQAPPEIFWITVNTNTLTADKTFDEIVAAADDNKLPIVFADGNSIYLFLYLGSTYMRFTRYIGASGKGLRCNSDDTWEIDYSANLQEQITASGLLKGDGAGGVTGIATGSSTTTYLRNDGEWATPPNSTYNFSGTTFYSGNSSTAEHNANNIVKNGTYYYTSNGPATSLGATGNDGALYAQSYSDSWVGQIAQDYRNGALYVRGKNNGTWADWQKVYDSAHKPTAADVGAAASSHNHNIQDLTNFSARVYDATVSRTKNTVLAAPNGSNGAASFRALVAADIPTLTKSKISDFPTSMTPTAHNHAAGDINSGTLGVARGGTGAASFTANCVVMSGSSTTAALTTRAVTNNTSSTAIATGTNIPTMNTIYYGLNHRLNRTTAVSAADTGYTTYMVRGVALVSSATNPTYNGQITWQYS